MGVAAGSNDGVRSEPNRDVCDNTQGVVDIDAEENILGIASTP
jgi:hypothetical protein